MSDSLECFPEFRIYTRFPYVPHPPGLLPLTANHIEATSPPRDMPSPRSDGLPEQAVSDFQTTAQRSEPPHDRSKILRHVPGRPEFLLRPDSHFHTDNPGREHTILLLHLPQSGMPHTFFPRHLTLPVIKEQGRLTLQPPPW